MADDAAAAAAAASGGGVGDDDWCTIESDPGVFTELLETIGCKTVELQELWSLDDDSLRQLEHSTGAVYGLIFLFQWIGERQREHAATKEPLAADDIPDDLFFAHQITTNACATQAILSVVLNAQPSKLPADDLGETLQQFQSFCREFPPHLRGMAISSSDTIKKAHNSFARQDGFLAGDKKARVASADDEAFHFVAYVPVNGVVYELDGLQSGPIVIGAYNEEDGEEAAAADDDQMKVDGDDDGNEASGGSDKNKPPSDWLLQARGAIQERMASGETVKFSLMAVIQDKRLLLQQRMAAATTGTADADEAAVLLATEQAKRDEWKTENQRRRHNYIPFCVQLLKELAAAGQLKQLVSQAEERQAQKRAAALEKKKAAAAAGDKGD